VAKYRREVAPRENEGSPPKGRGPFCFQAP
jgi:hypothetical protein